MWYADGNGKPGYYGFDGQSRRRSFLASPLAFSRVTSGFSMRMHPILQSWRRHLGVDYAAPTGTDVRVVGDGIVDFAGWQNGYGNVVQIAHGNDRMTLYAHLSRIDLKRGPARRTRTARRRGRCHRLGHRAASALRVSLRGQHQDPTRMARNSGPHVDRRAPIAPASKRRCAPCSANSTSPRRCAIRPGRASDPLTRSPGMSLFLGLMSGTSLDGIDGVGRFTGPTTTRRRCRSWPTSHQPFDAPLRDELMALNSPAPMNSNAARAPANALARAYASVVRAVLEQGQLAAAQVRAIGAHGQTVRHQPDAPAGGYTIQLLNGAVLAEAERHRRGVRPAQPRRRRRRTRRAPGAGLPCRPLRCPGEARAVLNIGGIANLTLLHTDGRVGGFDCGPANVLLDAGPRGTGAWPMTTGGRWARRGRSTPAAATTARRTLPASPATQEHRPGPFNAGWLDADRTRRSSARRRGRRAGDAGRIDGARCGRCTADSSCPMRGV